MSLSTLIITVPRGISNDILQCGLLRVTIVVTVRVHNNSSLTGPDIIIIAWSLGAIYIKVMLIQVWASVRTLRAIALTGQARANIANGHTFRTVFSTEGV